MPATACIQLLVAPGRPGIHSKHVVSQWPYTCRATDLDAAILVVHLHLLPDVLDQGQVDNSHHVDLINCRYYAWDTLNAACFLEPSICKMQQETVSIALEGTAQGAMLLAQSPRVTAESSKVASKALVLSKPKKVTVAADADASKFDSYMLKAFAG